jgi:branched-chain amino acid transport system substrate-binding protein
VHKVTLAFVAMLVAVGLAACGGASSSDDSGSKAAAAPAKSCPALSKAPISIIDISDATGLPGVPFHDFPDGAGVAVEHVNKDLCGVDGHPLKLIKCDSKFDPAATSACANEAVNASPLPVAQVGLSINLITNGSKTLHSKKLITLNVPDTPQDFADADSFPLGGGGGAEFPAAAYFAATTLGAKKPASVLVGTPAAKVFNQQFSAALKAEGVTAPLKTVVYPPTVADVTPFAAKSASGTDVIITNASSEPGNRFYTLWQQQGVPANKTINISASIDAGVLKKAGSAADGAYFTTEFKAPDDTSDPQVKEYRDAMGRYGSQYEASAAFTQWGFSNVMTLYGAIKAIGGDRAAAASVWKYFHATPSIPVFMGSPLRSDAAPKRLPALRNLAVTVVQWKAGKFEPVDGGKFFVAPTARA